MTHCLLLCTIHQLCENISNYCQEQIKISVYGLGNAEIILWKVAYSEARLKMSQTALYLSIIIFESEETYQVSGTDNYGQSTYFPSPTKKYGAK